MANLDNIIKSLEAEEKEILSNLKRIRNAISELRGDNNPLGQINPEKITVNLPEQSENKFIPKDGTWIEQIVSIIKNENRFLHSTEIAERLYSLYPNKTEHEVKRRVSTVLSVAKSNNTVEGLISHKFSNSKKDTVWGKSDWMDNEGKIKEEYQFEFSRDDKSQNKIEL